MSQFQVIKNKPPVRTISSAYLNAEARAILTQLADENKTSRSRIIESLLLTTGRAALQNPLDEGLVAYEDKD